VGIEMGDLIWLSDAQMRRIEPYFLYRMGFHVLTIAGLSLPQSLTPQ
jgi:hypothetical protein